MTKVLELDNVNVWLVVMREGSLWDQAARIMHVLTEPGEHKTVKQAAMARAIELKEKQPQQNFFIFPAYAEAVPTRRPYEIAPLFVPDEPEDKSTPMKRR